MLPPKTDVIAVLRKTLAEELEAIERVAAMARDETTSEETRQEGKYDTRAIESSYLARGQAERIVGLRRLSTWFASFQTRPAEVVQIGALVALDGHRPLTVFIAPVGGPRVQVGGQTVQVISLTSPLGQAMDDLEIEDGFEVDSPTGILEYEIIEIL